MPTEGKLITDIQRAWNGLLEAEKRFEEGLLAEFYGPTTKVGTIIE